MTRPEPMSYEAVFARSAPPPRPAPARRGKYDFAIAYPDPGSLPLDDLVDGLRSALEEEGRGLAVYPDIQGYPPLREFIAGKLARDRGMSVSPDQIVLGNGSSEPIDMLIQAVVDPGDVVLTEDYVYSGTLGRLRRYQAEIRGVACDENGMVPDALEATLRTAIEDGKKPKLIYTIPTFQNPQGWTAPLGRREALLSLSQEYGVPILEDDCYVDLRYDGEPVPAIHSLDDASHVMYVASFSKTIAPGLRTGYLVAPPEVVGRVRAIKGGAGANQFAAMAIHRYAVDHLDEHVAQIIGVQRARRDAMLAALGESFGTAATWSRPDGGLYIWLKMTEGCDLTEALDASLDAEVGYQTGNAYSPDGVSGKNYARLCFGFNDPEEIHEGISRLADVFASRGMLGR